MSAVRGSIVSSKSISLSSAARKLRRFVDSNTAAKPDIAAYLRRAATAFDNLVEFNNKLERGDENVGDEEIEERKEEDSVRELEDGDVASERKKKKKKKRKRENVDERSDIDLSKEQIDGFDQLEKEMNLDREIEATVNSEVDSGRKKKKRKKSEK